MDKDSKRMKVQSSLLSKVQSARVMPQRQTRFCQRALLSSGLLGLCLFWQVQTATAIPGPPPPTAPERIVLSPDEDYLYSQFMDDYLEALWNRGADGGYTFQENDCIEYFRSDKMTLKPFYYGTPYRVTYKVTKTVNSNNEPILELTNPGPMTRLSFTPELPPTTLLVGVLIMSSAMLFRSRSRLLHPNNRIF